MHELLKRGNSASLTFEWGGKIPCAVSSTDGVLLALMQFYDQSIVREHIENLFGSYNPRH